MAAQVRVVIQARTASSRFPGKIMAPLAGAPLLEQVVRRMRAADRLSPYRWEIMVATTAGDADDLTEALCRQLRVDCFRGPSEDVLARYVAATADLRKSDAVVRATADNPLYCPRRAAEIVHLHLTGGNDYTCIASLSYVVPEVMRVASLREMAQLADDECCREHVTPYFRRFLSQFRTQQLPDAWRGLRPDVPLTIDTPEQYRRLAGVFVALGGRGRLFALEETYAFWDSLKGDRDEPRFIDKPPRGRGRLRLDRTAAF